MISHRAAILLYGLFLLGLSAILLGAGEIVVRSNGWRPWQVLDPGIRVEPGGRFMMSHPVLGYTHIPGAYKVTLWDGYSFRVTHDARTLRITHPVDPAGAESRPEIWIFGCSFTHGWSLSDEETYPWLLQQRFPNHEVVNFGVSGYGTVQSLLQFREALGHRRPAMAVLAYASFHDARNTFLRSRRKETAPWNRLGPLVQPYARLGAGEKLELQMAEVAYTELPFMRHSALMHFVETRYNSIEDYFYKSHRVSEVLVAEMSGLARRNGVPLIVAGIWNDEPTQDMLRFASSLDVPVVDMSVDLDWPANNNLPHDLHPSAEANREYARQLGNFLGERVPRDP